MSDGKQMQLSGDLGAARRMSRDDRLDQIFERLTHVPFAVPLRDIARMVGMKKTWHLRSLVDELVREGTLIEVSEQEQPGLRATRMFYVNPDLR